MKNSGFRVSDILAWPPISRISQNSNTEPNVILTGICLSTDSYWTIYTGDPEMPGLDHLDKYVLQLIVLNLPTCPSWVVLASLSRRFYSIIRCIKAFEVDIPLFSTIQPTQLSNLLNTWDGTKTLCALNLSNVNYNISSSLFFLNKVRICSGSSLLNSEDY